MRRLVACMIVCLIALAVIVWASIAIYEQLHVDSYTQQPTIAEPPVPTAQLSPTPTPTPTPTSSPVPSEPASSPTTEATEVVEAEILADPVGLPQSVVVMCGDDQIASAPLQASTTPAGGVWQPPKATAEWWSYDNWARPGVAAREAAVIAAHVRYSGEPDAFSRLSEAGVGCTVEIQYPDSIALFRIVTDPEPIGKASITDEQFQHYWFPTETGTWLTLFTCDLLSGTRADGTLQGNIALKAIRIK